MSSHVRGLLVGATSARLVDGAKASTFAVLALNTTRSGVVVALLAMCATLPVVLLGPHIGLLIDRRSPRSTSLAALSAQSVILAAATVVLAATGSTIPLVLVCALALGVCQAVTDNSLNALAPELVRRDELTAVNGSMTTFQTAARVAGPAAFGAMVVWSPVTTFACWTVLSAIAFLSVRGIQLCPVETSRDVPRASVFAGLRWIAQSPEITALLIGVTLANIALGAMAAVLPIFAVRDLGVPESTYGLGSSVMAVTGILGSFVASRASRARASVTLTAARAVQTVGLVILLLSQHAASFFAAMAVVGLASGVWNVVSSTALMAAVPAGSRGQVMASYRSVAFAGGPVGNAAGGAASALTPRGGLGVAALVSLISTLAVLRVRHQIAQENQSGSSQPGAPRQHVDS